HGPRKESEPGEKTPGPGKVTDVEVTPVAEEEWPVLSARTREFTSEELAADPIWASRAAEAEVSLEAFYAKAREFSERGVIGRFSTFLEHYKKLSKIGRAHV